MSESVGSVTRSQVVQACLDLFENPEYLEIGVWKGKAFFLINAARKVAVDPKLAFDVQAARVQHANAEVFEITSDEYFGKIDNKNKFDVIHLDGLHTLEQTLRGLINAISFLKDGDIIVIDDVYPPTYQALLANLSHSHVVKKAAGSDDKSWMGDVYRLVFFIESFCQQLEYALTSNNHGQLIVWRKARHAVPERTLKLIARAPFKAIFLEEAHLKRKLLNDIISEIRESRNNEEIALASGAKVS